MLWRGGQTCVPEDIAFAGQYSRHVDILHDNDGGGVSHGQEAGHVRGVEHIPAGTRNNIDYNIVQSLCNFVIYGATTMRKSLGFPDKKKT